LVDGVLLPLKFTDVKIITFDSFIVKEVDNLILDNLYRGRVELNGDLIEISEMARDIFIWNFMKVKTWSFGLKIWM